MSGKSSFLCECTRVTILAEDTVSLEFTWPGQQPLGGQFFLIKPRRTSVFLGRPISVANYKAGTLSFLITKRGRGSSELIGLQPGEKALLTGPLGNFWPVEDFKGSSAKNIALVAGGIGIAPLLMPAMALQETAVKISEKTSANSYFDFYAGFRTMGPLDKWQDILKLIKPGKLVISTEDGSQGKKGQILDFFEPKDHSAVFACGPEQMLKVLAKTCINAQIPCFISVERHMACGVGACLSCKVKTSRGNLNCCVDGPIFRAEELCFDE